MRHVLMGVVLLTLLAGPGAGQETPSDYAGSALVKGRWAVGFNWPFSNGGYRSQFEIRRMTGDRSSIGLMLDLHAEDREASGDTANLLTLKAGPNLRRYVSKQARVAPYFQVGASLYYQRYDQSGGKTTARGLNGTAGVGVEWFPWQRVSVGGETGFEVSWLDGDEDHDSPRPDEWSRRTSIDTFTSSLSVQVYF